MALVACWDEQAHQRIVGQIGHSVFVECSGVVEHGPLSREEDRCLQALCFVERPGLRDIDAGQDHLPLPTEAAVERSFGQALQRLATRDHAVLCFQERGRFRHASTVGDGAGRALPHAPTCALSAAPGCLWAMWHRPQPEPGNVA
jgi:hypothetical protein